MPDTNDLIREELLSVLRDGEPMDRTTLALKVVDNLQFYGLENQVESVLSLLIGTGKIKQNDEGKVYI